jgi:hypothetical protein
MGLDGFCIGIVGHRFPIHSGRNDGFNWSIGM